MAFDSMSFDPTSFETATRATEILLALALAQQSIEHLSRDFWMAATRLALCAALGLGLFTAPVLIGLLITGIALLHRYDGPYNGGSDRLGLLILICVTLVHVVPPAWQELALGYLAIQLILSYTVSGYVKIINPDWRNGRALADVFAFSVYPVSENLRHWCKNQRSLSAASWGVMGFELAFPLVLIAPLALWIGLAIAATFHLANACLFGLNRFLWTWIAAYPAIIWFQARILAPV